MVPMMPHTMLKTCKIELPLRRGIVRIALQFGSILHLASTLLPSTMFPNVKPSAETNERAHRTNEQLSSIRPPERVAVANTAHTRSNYWVDNAGQLDYFHFDPMYRTALTPSRSWSISPIKRSNRPTSTIQTAGHQTYPSQELNPRYADLLLSPPNSDGSWNLPPLPSPLPPPDTDISALKTHVEEVISMATSNEPSQEVARKILVEEVTSSMATGFNDYIEELYNPLHVNSRGAYDVEPVVDANVFAAQSKSVGFDFNDNCNSGSAMTKKKHQASRAAKNTKCSAKTTPGIERPNEFDILRGRGGLTNRHEGNMRFRDEARKLRARYRHENTKREEKFILSQVLVRRVKEYGGRFLELGTDQLWHEMDEHGARKKASQGMNACSSVTIIALDQ